MKAVGELEDALERAGGDVGKQIEQRAKIKKTLTHPSVGERLKRLEFKGAMVWGMSVEERQAIETLKEKVKAC